MLRVEIHTDVIETYSKHKHPVSSDTSTEQPMIIRLVGHKPSHSI